MQSNSTAHTEAVTPLVRLRRLSCSSVKSVQFKLNWLLLEEPLLVNVIAMGMLSFLVSILGVDLVCMNSGSWGGNTSLGFILGFYLPQQCNASPAQQVYRWVHVQVTSPGLRYVNAHVNGILSLPCRTSNVHTWYTVRSSAALHFTLVRVRWTLRARVGVTWVVQCHAYAVWSCKLSYR